MIEKILDFDAFFFDFDGLLASTEKLHYLAYQKMLNSHGFDLKWDFKTYCRYAHVSTEYLATAVYDLFPTLKALEPKWDVLREEKQRIYLDILDEKPVDLMPGVSEFITLLTTKSKPIYVVTNAPQEQVIKIKKKQPILDAFDFWITREFYNAPKPSPECYLKALEIHGDINCKAIGFEDSIKGFKALCDSPIFPVLICPTDYLNHLLENQKIKAYYPSFDDLLKSCPHSSHG